MKNRKVPERNINLLKLRPVRSTDWKEENELVVLLKPKFKHPFFKKILLPRMKNPFFKIKLDSVGSYTWKLCDGSSSVEEIAKSMKHKFGDDIEPLYERLAQFLQNLEKNNFISYE